MFVFLVILVNANNPRVTNFSNHEGYSKLLKRSIFLEYIFKYTNQHKFKNEHTQNIIQNFQMRSNSLTGFFSCFVYSCVCHSHFFYPSSNNIRLKVFICNCKSVSKVINRLTKDVVNSTICFAGNSDT